ncbi:AI-2E family transporter [Salinicoccus halitifaciens]|uniref:PurR-regulated permease PerM n=1 Tax=Salinicoccus halitifaciens TaxID=1073415 RepID=A0ABV2ECI5_9STAP|nr:AI-2E family transporter [Salinicoccus halitifaciens]MCD2138709.1 AI-2E family transporter [Salinicoccus halitifaciens]
MANKAWFQSGVAIIITLLIIMLVIQVQVVFEPLFTIIATIFIPVLLGGLLYYITQPIQSFLEKRKAKRLTAILAVFLIILIVINILVMVIVPVISDQIQNLVQRMPALQRDFQNILAFLSSQREELPFDVDIEGFTENLLDQSGEIVSNIASNAISILTSTVSVILTLVLVPFFYFFMLKDHEKFVPAMVSPFSGTVKQFLTEWLYDVDRTLRSFIQGQVLVSFILGVILYIGYTIIGLEYALLLGMLALFLNVIPFIGPWLAFAPAGILALIQSPIMFVWVAIITLIAQQIESNLITPNVMGQSLKLHPLTVIVVVLAAGNIAGFIGMLVAIPTYAVIKTSIQNIWRYRKALQNTLLTDVQPHLKKHD